MSLKLLIPGLADVHYLVINANNYPFSISWDIYVVENFQELDIVTSSYV